MINDITSYLYSSQAAALQKTAATGTTPGSNKTSNADASDSFTSFLSKEVSSYSEAESLAAVLDKSVLGSVSYGSDLSALSQELLSTGSGREVIAQLAEGHLDAIAMSDGDEDDESTTIADTLTDTTATDTDTLNQILDKLNEIAANGTSQKE